MTDDQMRTAIDLDLQQWVRQQIAKGRPAGLVKERIAVVRGLGFNADRDEQLKQMREQEL